MVEFRRNGRKVSQREFIRGIHQNVLSIAADEIEGRLRRVRCPVHGTGPKNVRQVSTNGDIRLVADMCCEEGEKAAEQALA